MATRVLITGGAGYLGSVLCEHLLDRGYEVTVIDTLLYGQNSSLFHLAHRPGFECVFGDARNEQLVQRYVKKADVIIPLAAIVGVPACDRDPLLTRSVNFEAVAMINRLRSPEQLIVYPNSNSGYGTKSGEVFCTEDSPLEPISLYGQTKVAAENDVLQKENSVVLRLATVFGMSPRMRLDLLVNHFTYVAVTDGYIVIFEKDFKRNFIHVRDIADCFIHCIEHGASMRGRAYNAGLDSANVSKEDLALTIKEAVPNFFIHFSDVGTDPDKRNYVVSNERLRTAGFEAKRSLEEGIQELIRGYQFIKRHPMKNV